MCSCIIEHIKQAGEKEIKGEAYPAYHRIFEASLINSIM